VNRPALLDVSVPMYAAGQPHVYKESCVWIMSEVAAGGLDVAIDTEIVQEILYHYGALQRWDVAVALATDLLTLVPTIYPVRVADAQLAVTLFAQYAPQGISARDLVHAAVMHNRDLTQIISVDAHFDRIAGITRLDPRVLYARRT
jgi:predicted nucleic acid-binding protein